MDLKFSDRLAAQQEQDARISTRLDALQAQVVELQKGPSPGSSPNSGRAGLHAVPPTSPSSGSSSPSLEMVLGGWRDGERKDYIEDQLSKLWSAAGVASAVRQVVTFGKRPRCAKVSLNFPEGGLAERRAFLADVISKVKGQGWKPRDCTRAIWVVEDRPPAARSVNKAVAIMGAFIEKTLKYTAEGMEVDSWPAARAYLGDQRISGACPGAVSCPPPLKGDYIVWPVQDANTQVSVWMDLQAVAQSTLFSCRGTQEVDQANAGLIFWATGSCFTEFAEFRRPPSFSVRTSSFCLFCGRKQYPT